MGAAGSVRSSEMASDSWWSPLPARLQSASNGLTEEGETTQADCGNKVNEDTAIGEELWLKQIQDLGKVIQNLASENLKLIDSNKELKQICKEHESKLCEKICNEEENEEVYSKLNIVTSLQEAASNDKKIIEDLKQQLQTNTENNAVEVERYHENLNFMHMKVKEYEQVVEKLEKDAAVQIDAIQSLQSSLMSADSDGKVIEVNVLEMKETIETLKQEHKESLEENKTLKEQLETERTLSGKVHDENEKLREELQQIKHFICVNRVKRASENSDADSSDVDRDVDQSATGSSSSQNEEARTLSPRAAAELEVFQNQMKVKREARHKALSAISMEMERLRRELNNEREVRRNAVKELESARSTCDEHHIFEEVNALKHKLSTQQQEKDKIYKELIEAQKQGNEEIENILKKLEKEKAKSEHIMGENKYMKEQLQESDLMLQSRSEENNQLQNKLDTDREKYQQQVLALKEVIAISKQMLTVRENQVTHLKQTLQDIEASVVEKQRGSLTATLRAEYETQMENIKSLKALYEERMQVMNVEKEKLISEQKDLQRLVEEEKRRVEVMETKLQEKEDIISERNVKVSDLQDQLSDAIDQSRDLSYELTLINNMFTQILGSSDMDLDRLTKLLQENHDLITEITTKNDCSETTASLPKMLLDLVCNAENNTQEKEKECSNDTSHDSTSSSHDTAETSEPTGVVTKTSSNSLAMQDISSNLPKVWKVLLELVSHHVPSPTEESSEDCKSSCYKNVDTPYGPKSVISVSKTFLRLRDLILQKKSLQKEVTRLKQLNVHLETKLNDQERRLSLVSSELRKTWNVVDHMRVQHQQLHTHEKVLRYELQQKRKLLMELKEELEYCREKWEEARQKNSQSEIEWQNLRKEFAQRKNKPLNNSGESGFSEEKDEDGTDNDAIKMQCQRKSSNSGLNNLQNVDCIDQQMKTDEPEIVNSTASLPDLVAVAADIPLSHSDIQLREIASNEMDTARGDSISLLQNVPNAFSLENSMSNTPCLGPSLLEDCATVSLITLLKQQLSCFSKNLEVITTDFDTNDHFRALQSIFALPAIQIPEHLNPCAMEPLSDSKISNSDNSTRASIDQGIQGSDENVKTREETISKNISTPILEDKFGDNCKTTPLLSDSSSSGETENSKNEPSSPQSVEETCTSDDSGSHLSTMTNQETRSERLQRIERQCQQLFEKVTRPSATSCSTSSVEPKPENKSQEGGSSRNLEEMLDARAARLKRLEEQSQQLFKKVTRTTHRSTALSNRLEELHEQYGSEESVSNVAGSEAVSQNSSNSKSSNQMLGPSLQPNDLVPSTSSASDFSEIRKSLPEPSISSHIPTPPPIEDILDARAARLKRLEEQSQQLLKKVTKTTHRSERLSNRLEELHEQYGNEVAAPISRSCSISTSSNIPQPPPFPDHLLPNYVSSSTNETQEKAHEFPDSCPSTSSNIPIPPPSLEDVLDDQKERLKRLEEQPKQSFDEVRRATHSKELTHRLEELHEHGGEDINKSATNDSVNYIPEPPPLPNPIVSIRLPTSSLVLTSNHIPSPPPLPENLPSVRLPTELDLQRLQEKEEECVCATEREQR